MKPEQHTAFLVCDETLWRATSVVELIQGIWERCPEQARRILRSRIHATENASEMTLAMVKVAAKRMTAGLPLAEISLPPHVREIEVTAPPPAAPPDFIKTLIAALIRESPPSDDQDFMRLAFTLIQAPNKTGKRFECDRPVAALLVSAENRILAYGINTNARNRTQHAELNMIRGYQHETGSWLSRGLPRGSRIYTTLKSCKMCAGMIWSSAEDISCIKVFYGEFDPGPMGRRTVLNVGSHERLRAALNEKERTLELEWALVLDRM